MRLRVLQVLMVSLPLVCRPGSGAFDGPKQMMLAFGAAALLSGRAVACWRGRAWSWPSGRSTTAVALVLSAGLVSLTGAAQAEAVWRNLWTMALWSYLLLEVAALPAAGHRNVLACLIAGGVMTSLIGLAQGIGLLPGGDPSAKLPITVSTLGNRNEVAGLAAVLAAPALGLLGTAKGGRRTLVLIATGVLVVTVAVLDATGPRLALLLAVACLAAVFSSRRRGREGRFVFPLAAVLVVVVWASASVVLHERWVSGPRESEASTLSSSDKSSLARLLDWRIAWDLGRDNPLSGVGLGGYGPAWFEARETLADTNVGTAFHFHTQRATRAHNDLLQWWSETGVVGVVALLGSVLLLLPGMRRRNGNPDSVYLLAALIATLVLVLVSFPLHRPTSGLAFVVLIGLLIGGRDRPSPNSSWAGRPVAVAMLGLAVAVSWFAFNLQRAEFLADRAQAEIRAGNFNAAAEHLEHARALTPWPGTIAFEQGLVALRRGKEEEGAAFLEESLSHEPTYRALLMLAEVRMSRGFTDDALDLIMRLQKHQPESRIVHDAWFLEGRLALKRGDVGAATEAWRRILSRDEGYHRALVALGSVAARSNDTAGARRHYEAALTLIDRKILKANLEDEPWRRNALVQDRRSVAMALESLSVRRRPSS